MDEFATESSRPRVGERTWPASLYHRAESRLGDVDRYDQRTWTVQGRTDLGDVQSSYDVRRVGDDYWCECTNNKYGDTRRRRGCSHALAVMITVARG